jgi:hypothetical protein
VNCRRCAHPLAPAHTPKWALVGRRRHYGRGLCGSCYQWAREHNASAMYPLMGQYGRLTPENCPVCDEVDAMRAWATAEQIVTALGRTAEAVDIHLRRHSPHLREVIAPLARRENAARKRARAA